LIERHKRIYGAWDSSLDIEGPSTSKKQKFYCDENDSDGDDDRGDNFVRDFGKDNSGSCEPSGDHTETALSEVQLSLNYSDFL
jgi:hypothetical protein